MQHDSERIRTALEEQFPGWQIWIVWHAVGKRRTWCAMRWGDDVATFNADSPDELAEMLSNAEP